MKETYGAKTDKAQWLRFHTQTAGVSLTAQQPYNNVVRTAVEALSAVLGGTNSLHTNALDETLALPSEQAAEIALRTQQVLMEETGVANVADPLGGSWYVEQLTDRIEADAEKIFEQIRERGTRAHPDGRHPVGPMTSGILRGIEDGWFTGETAESAFRYQQSLEKGRSGSSASTSTTVRSPATWRSCGSAMRSSESRCGCSPGARRAARTRRSARRWTPCWPPRATVRT